MIRPGLQEEHVDKEPEEIYHLMMSCVFSRSVWALVLQALGMLHLAPQNQVCFFFGHGGCRLESRLPALHGNDLTLSLR